MEEAGFILEATGLVQKYGRTVALDGVSVRLAQGRTTTLIGPNGAGKTTLLQVLGGLRFPNSGHVTVHGLHRFKQNFEARMKTTYLSAEAEFGECRTPWEYLLLVGGAYRMTDAQSADRARPLCEQMNMMTHMTTAVGTLSLGMRKKVGLIGAFLPEVPLRILDEPFAGGIDPLAVEALRGWIAASRARGETLLLSTQMLDPVQDLTDRWWVLDKGTIVHDKTTAELTAAAGVDASDPRALGKAFASLLRADLGGEK